MSTNTVTLEDLRKTISDVDKLSNQFASSPSEERAQVLCSSTRTALNAFHRKVSVDYAYREEGSALLQNLEKAHNLLIDNKGNNFSFDPNKYANAIESRYDLAKMLIDCSLTSVNTWIINRL